MSGAIIGAVVAAAAAGYSAHQQGEARDRADELQNLSAREANTRDARIDHAVSQINHVYDSPKRQAQYTDFADALRQHFNQQLQRKNNIATRRLKFSMARSGLTGGSVAADTGHRLADEFTQGALKVGSKTQSAVSRLKGEDALARRQLIQMAKNGLGATTATQRALESSQSSLASAMKDAPIQMLGDVFAGTASTYKKQQEAAERRKGFGYSAKRKDIYGGE